MGLQCVHVCEIEDGVTPVGSPWVLVCTMKSCGFDSWVVCVGGGRSRESHVVLKARVTVGGGASVTDGGQRCGQVF